MSFPRQYFVDPFGYHPFYSGTRPMIRSRQPYSGSPSWDHQLVRLNDKIFDMGTQLDDITDLFSSLTRFGCPSPVDFFGSSIESTVEGGAEDQQGKYTMNVPMDGDIKPEDLKVSLKDHMMTIEAKKEVASEDGNFRVYKEFSKTFTLPPSVDMKEVKSVLTPEGYLKIEAPLPQQSLPEPETAQEQKQQLKMAAPTEIPIKMG